MITIVTSTLNCREALRLTAESIARQRFEGLQWIVIDGESKDGTVDVIKEMGSLIDYSISEPDSGIYDAWNKACKAVKSEWVLFLGAGDVFAADDVLSTIAKQLQNYGDNVAFVYGDVIDGSPNGKKIGGGEIKEGDWGLYRPKLPCHQGVFQRASFLKTDNPFDTDYKIVADTKLLLQMSKVGRMVYIPCDVAIMAPGGVSQSAKSVMRVRAEFLRLQEDMGYSIPLLNRLLFGVYAYMKFAMGRLGVCK